MKYLATSSFLTQSPFQALSQTYGHVKELTPSKRQQLREIISMKLSDGELMKIIDIMKRYPRILGLAPREIPALGTEIFFTVAPDDVLRVFDLICDAINKDQGI